MAPVHRVQIAQLEQDLADGIEETRDGAGAVLDAPLEALGLGPGPRPLAAHPGVLLAIGATVAGVGAHLMAQALKVLDRAVSAGLGAAGAGACALTAPFQVPGTQCVDQTLNEPVPVPGPVRVHRVRHSQRAHAHHPVRCRVRGQGDDPRILPQHRDGGGPGPVGTDLKDNAVAAASPLAEDDDVSASQ